MLARLEIGTLVTKKMKFEDDFGYSRVETTQFL